MARKEKAVARKTTATEGYVWQILDELNLSDGAPDIYAGVRIMASKSRLADRELFVRLESAIASDIENRRLTDRSIAANLMLDIAAYYENIGEPDQSFLLSLRALKYSDQTEDKCVKRRAHSFVGALSARLLDFNCACMNLHQAYSLAKQIGDPVAVFATLANTVAVLEMMGLLSAAKDLASKLAHNEPKGSEVLDYLHLSNASNGLRIAHLLSDRASSEVFYRVATSAIETQSSFVNEITKSHYEAARIVFLASSGKTCEAEQLAIAALAHRSFNNNIKARALLVCAQAFVHMELGCPEKLEYSCIAAVELLDKTVKLPEQHEELLRTLVKIYSLPNGDAKSIEKALKYLRLLGTHTLSVKHKQFFTNTALNIIGQSDCAFVLENPSYALPKWIAVAGCSFEENEEQQYELSSQRRDVPFDVNELNSMTNETEFRTAAFNVAENWAVAAEFAGGGTGQHCFNVGRVAAAIARRLRFSSRDVVRLELACRLHDIGRVAVAFRKEESSEPRVLGTLSSSCEHTTNGAVLLSSSSDKTLLLAACIAKSHHEWWNGCGYPASLTGEKIPLEGRICAIADAFVSLVHNREANQRWTVDEAIRQIQSMAGMQLDPQLIVPLIQAVTESGHDATNILASGRVRLDENQLIRSKKDLFSVLELVD